jgi:hypothetical protein
MNFSNTIVFFFLLPFHLVNANDIIQILLNNGEEDHYCVDQWNDCCTSSEWDRISRSIYTMSMNQRHTRALRGNETNHDDAMMEGIDSTGAGNNIDVTRELAYPRQCANNCRAYPAGRCMALNCYGYRQRRSMLESIASLVGQGDRDLFWATNCDNQKSEVNNLLNNLQYQFGPRCRSLLNAPRILECYSDVDC